MIRKAKLKAARMIKLHLGCYDRKMYGWINVDVREDCQPDLVDDCFALPKLAVNYADVIYGSHMLEHASRADVPGILKRWYDVLKPGGTLYVAVPDLEAAFAHYFYHKDLRLIYSMLYGSQNYPEDYHKTGFDFETIQAMLVTAGFQDVSRYDWKKTDFWYVDDHSKGYWPHMDQIHGKLMSLNVQATRPKSDAAR